MAMGTDRILRRVAIGVVVGCVLVVGVTATAVAVPSVAARLGLASAAVPSYPVDGRIDLPDEVFATRPFTLIYFVRSSCPACQLATPMLTAMVHDVSGNAGVRVVLVTPLDSAKAEEPFARELGLDDSAIVAVDVSWTQGEGRADRRPGRSRRQRAHVPRGDSR